MPLHIVRELYSTFGNFRKRIADFIRYRRVIVNMNTRFPTASNADLADMDRTCIVCREEMNGAGMNAPTHLVSKKLPCGHIFHFDCLRSWLEDNTTCPTCRGPVEPPPTPTQRPARGTPQRGPVIPQTPEARPVIVQPKRHPLPSFTPIS
jgi:E3 ubiquitin-protein ligase synoviolin